MDRRLQQSDPHLPRTVASVGALWAVFAAGVLLWTLFQLPRLFDFIFYGFEDLGGSARAAHLVGRGLRPTVDFYYPYGLLPLLVGAGWFGLWGATAWAFLAVTLACNLLLTWGLARFVSAVRGGWLEGLFLLATLVYVARPVYLNITHAFEAVLLVHALAEHARGRRRVALTLTTVCAFVKPSMAYVYGAVLLALIARDLVRSKARAAVWRRELGPAAVAGAGLLILLVAYFGVEPLLHVQIPLGGAASYRAVNYGFFTGSGRNLWGPPGVGAGYYLGTPAGLWIAATTVLVAVGLLRGGEVVRTALAMHVAFVLVFYGATWDWVAYFFVLAMGLVAAASRSRWARVAVTALVPLAVVGHWSMVRDTWHAWGTQAPSVATAGLWASAGERAEWRRVLEIAQGQTVLMPMSGAAELLFPGFAAPQSFYLHGALVEPLMPQVERARISSRLQTAPTVVSVRNSPADVAGIPLLRKAMVGCRLAWRGEHFSVYGCD